MKQTKFAKSLALCAGVLVFSAFASYMIFAWTAPSSTPPSNNADAPLNTGFTAQGKIGNLGIGITTPRAKLDINGTIYLTGGNVSNIPSTIGFQSSDAALLVPTYTGTENSDLRLYLEDNSNERFSIWGNSCGGGGCMNLDNSSLAHSFEAGGDAYHKGYVKGQTGVCIGNDCRTAWPTGGGGASSCADGEWVIGIDENGEVICTSNGTTPWSTVSCAATTDAQLKAENKRRIFVTGGTYNNSATDSVAEVDNICNNEAASAGLQPAGQNNYKALIYFSGARVPQEVLANHTYRICGIENEEATWHDLATSAASMLATSLPFPIKYGPTGELVDATVWVSFKPLGSGNVSGYNRCWRNCSGACGCSPIAASYTRVWGESLSTGIGWAFVSSPTNCHGCVCSCDAFRALYCVQQ